MSFRLSSRPRTSAGRYEIEAVLDGQTRRVVIEVPRGGLGEGTVDFSGSRQIQHALKSDRRFLIVAVAFTDQSWPHRVMDFHDVWSFVWEKLLGESND